MAPLKALRECCTAILSDDGKTNLNVTAKKSNICVITSDNLLRKMKEHKEIIRTQELDVLVCNLKNLSNSYLQRNENSKAFDCYKQILKLAQDYNKNGKLM